jgi:integrase
VLDAAKARGLRSGENPAAWRGNLKVLLPKRKRLTRGHHPALPYVEMPAFMADLRSRDAMAALALEFCILTATRTGETLGAEWKEIDLETGLWVIPAARMKVGKDHRIPLSRRALEVLAKLTEARTGRFVFPGPRRGKPLSNMAMMMLLRRMRQGKLTVHGFRSAFRDWAGNETSFAREIAEAALAHIIGDAAERAYRRGDALEKRRAMMEAWAQWCEPKEATVVALAKPDRAT